MSHPFLVHHVHAPPRRYGASKLFCGVGSIYRSYVHTISLCTSSAYDGESCGRGTRERVGEAKEDGVRWMWGRKRATLIEIHSVSESLVIFYRFLQWNLLGSIFIS